MKSDPCVVGIMLSDMVLKEQGTGKTSLINCFSIFNADKFPFVTSPFFITPFITNLEGKPREINITVRIEEPKSGHVLGSANGRLQAAEDAPPLTRDAMIELPFRFQLRLANPGKYDVHVLLDKESLGHRSFLVVARTTSPQLKEHKEK